MKTGGLPSVMRANYVEFVGTVEASWPAANGSAHIYHIRGQQTHAQVSIHVTHKNPVRSNPLPGGVEVAVVGFLHNVDDVLIGVIASGLSEKGLDCP